MRQNNILLASLLSFIFGIAPSARCQWVHTSGPSGTQCLTAAGANLFAATFDSGIFRSSDNGISWTAQNNGWPATTVLAIGSIGANVFAGTDGGLFNQTGFAGVYRSTDNGGSWNRTMLQEVFSIASSGSELFASSWDKGIFLSKDTGANWTDATGDLASMNEPRLAIYGSNIFAACWTAGVYRSTNRGANWTNGGDAGLTVKKMYAILPIGDTNAPTLIVGTIGGIFRSTDIGMNWKLVDNHNTQTFAVSGANTASQILFAGTSNGIIMSKDNGTKWVNTGFTGGFVDALLVHGSDLFADGGGVWHRPLSEFGASSVGRSNAATIEIEVSPNPTNGIVTVHGVAAGARVEVASILGERVMNLAGTGATDRTLDLSSFRAGSYFIRVSCAGSATTKMIVKE
jgi:photosystem II stability/assembly factor-like uncharacterized protein